MRQAHQADSTASRLSGIVATDAFHHLRTRKSDKAHADLCARENSEISQGMMPAKLPAHIPDDRFRSLWITSLGVRSDSSNAQLAEKIDEVLPGGGACQLIENGQDSFRKLWAKSFGLSADFDHEKLLGLISQFFTAVGIGGQMSAPILNSASVPALDAAKPGHFLREALIANPDDPLRLLTIKLFKLGANATDAEIDLLLQAEIEKKSARDLVSNSKHVRCGRYDGPAGLRFA